MGGTWPVLGMLIVAIAHVFYEVHDEVKVITDLTNMGFPTYVFSVACNMHFSTSLAVAAGILPMSWLCCNSMGYPVAKAALASGALRNEELVKKVYQGRASASSMR